MTSVIRCGVCGREMRTVTNTHLATHGLSTTAYAERYAEPFQSVETRLARSRFRGDPSRIGLGAKPDSAIARELGIDRHTVKRMREERSIPAFAGLLVTQEGLPCRSMYEAMYDAWLHWQGIAHTHEVWIPDLRYRADFRVENRYVEIVGMRPFIRYERKYLGKREAYRIAGIEVDWLTPEVVERLYSACPIRLRFNRDRKCIDCGAISVDLVKSRCRKTCYMRYWREVAGRITICVRCGSEFHTNGAYGKVFCSHACYARSLELEWPTWEWIDDQLRSKSGSHPHA